MELHTEKDGFRMCARSGKFYFLWKEAEEKEKRDAEEKLRKEKEEKEKIETERKAKEKAENMSLL